MATLVDVGANYCDWFSIFSLSPEKIDKQWLRQDVWNRRELKEQDD